MSEVLLAPESATTTDLATGVAVWAGRWMSSHVTVHGQASGRLRAGVYMGGQGVQTLMVLPDAGLRLVQPVLASVKWEPVTGAYAAYEEVFGTWFGLGPTVEAAMSNLGAVLGETFRDLEAEADRLAPPVGRQLEQLRRVVAYADARP